MKFIRSIKILTEELSRLYDVIEGLPPDIAEDTIAKKKMLEIKAAIGILEKYDFEIKAGNKNGVQ
jgi:hypothetical protein